MDRPRTEDGDCGVYGVTSVLRNPRSSKAKKKKLIKRQKNLHWCRNSISIKPQPQANMTEAQENPPAIDVLTSVWYIPEPSTFPPTAREVFKKHTNLADDEIIPHIISVVRFRYSLFQSVFEI